ncbi:hypothetical protein LPJ74_000578 [Coemansia sp. RSA 1843]|nr:hypothetical protein LPJ74_000578 [Coemansia sp. RSA 1843]
MDTDTTPRSNVPFAHQPAASEAGNTFRDNSDSTFIVNPKADTSTDPSRMNQRPPVSASDFNHMFSPLALERMFQQNAALATGDDSSEAQAPSISGLLWQNREARPSDDTFEGAGNTLQQLLSNGSNPVEGTGSNSYHEQQQQQQQGEQIYSMTPTVPITGYQGMLISPSSPPDTAPLMSSVNMNRRSLEAMRPMSAVPPSHAANHRKSVQIDPRRLPPVPRSASRASIVSMASTSAHPRYGQTTQNDVYRPGSSLAPAPQLARHSLQQLNDRSHQMHSSNTQRPNSSNGHNPGYPAEITMHGQQQTDLSLRHEVLDKVARKSQPPTPYDIHMMPLPSVSVPQSPAQRPATADIRPSYEYPNDDIVTMLPGDNQPRPYVWATRDDSDPQNKQHRRDDHHHQKTLSLHKSGTVSRMGSLRKLDYPGISQARKTSDGSAHLLTPNDFHAPLPYRVGDMVLDKEIGEWVHISEFVHSSAGASPVTRGSPSTAVETQQTRVTVSRGPASGRSSVSQHSHMSAFPLPLPVENKERNGSANTAYGMGLISPVENQRKVVHEMAERKAVGRRESAAVRRRPIEDEALGSIVQRLMTPAASPDGCTALDLSGSGIRNLAGLAQITSRLEAICLTGNKLRGLAGLPTGLVSLKASSNWIRFSVSDTERFMFARELPHLEEIDLSSNEISDIQVFSGLRHLRVLDLSRNRIESLAPLRGCRRLLHLALRDNSLSALDLDANEAPLLSTLDVCNNRLRVIPASIGEFTHLVKANMVRNDLECVEFHGPPAESIRELRLSENPLVVRRDGGVVDVRVWSAKFPNLKTLYLDICNIRAMASSEEPEDDSHMQLSPPPPPPSSNMDRRTATGPVIGWSSLFNLSLRGSALQPSLSVAFESLGQLKNLYAPDTQFMLPRSLPLLGNLLQLVLPNAGLSRLPSNMGAALPRLRLLDISNNPELTDFMPILQLAPSLEVLRCRTVGFGGLSNAVSGGGGFDAAAGGWPSSDTGDSGPAAVSADERAMLRWLSKLKRLRRLDFRFNKCTFDLYAPPVHSNGPVAGAGGTNALLEAVLSPQLQSPHVLGGDVPNSAAISVQSRNATHQQQQQQQPQPQCHVVAGRIDEDAWLRNDHAYLANLKMGRHARLIQRRDDYWIAAISSFPRLEELDGIKVGLH